MLALCAISALPASAAGSERACQQMQQSLLRGGGQASGLFVVDADTGRRLCGQGGNRVLPLASNTKMFTTATALAELGPQTRIQTKLLRSGEIDSQGTLRGHLYLVGGGDPALGSPDFNNRFLGGFGTNMLALRGKLRAAGIRRVTGRLFADDTIFDRRRGVADSGFATSPYIGPISGLAFNSGYSSSRGYSFASDPALLAARKLNLSLRRGGVAIRPQVALRAAPRDAALVGAVRSPTIAQLATVTNEPSNNFYAEMLVKVLGARFGGGGSTAAGTAVVEEFASSLGARVDAVDGSGLTRTNSASPIQVTRFLQGMLDTEVRDDYIASLAKAGQEGTVARRMRGSAADGRCETKTGTLTGVSALSGYCFNRSGRTIVFSILMGSVGSLSLAHAEQDRIAAIVASY